MRATTGTAANRARSVMGDSQVPLAPHVSIGGQFFNITTDGIRQIGLLRNQKMARLYPRAPQIPASLGVTGTMPTQDGTDYSHIREEQLALRRYEFAFRYSRGNEHVLARPRYDARDPDVRVLTSLAGMPCLDREELRQAEHDEAARERARYKYQFMIETVGLVDPVDSDAATNGKTVALGNGIVTIVNTGWEDIFEGDLIETIVAFPFELKLCRGEDAHKQGTRPVLVTRRYDPLRTMRAVADVIVAETKKNIAAGMGPEVAHLLSLQTVRALIYRNVFARALVAIPSSKEGDVHLGRQ